MISPGVQLSNSATFFLDDSMAALTFLPWACVEEGLPKSSVRKGFMASNTSGSNGVVAALSRYMDMACKNNVLLPIEANAISDHQRCYALSAALARSSSIFLARALADTSVADSA